MFPTIFTIGTVSLHSYGLFVAIGCLAGFFLARVEARRKNIDPDRISDLVFYALIAGIVGARLFYALTDPAPYIQNPLALLKIWEGGLVFYGAFILAVPTIFIYARRHGLKAAVIFDILAPGLALGHFFGRIGCFLAGCCYGKASDLPFAVVFQNPGSLAPLNLGLHPVQLYSALSNLLIFGFLWLLRKRLRIDGQLFWVYVLLYAAARFFLEFFRGDFRGDFVFGILSPAQTLGVAMAGVSMVCLALSARRASSDR
ncbi:Prolipoprotein diacylglyceryl transferase [Candidatus Desulfarcum epimagneticum]|uniref:Phosphatidylglycerol--prolipoprotein diacylglyceryl transferase n=1 Tax=uncultured Desulfobacteraceae bacterium TaxID=218296 RepID=A0A484HGP8_9BACT|nr:Prolipoprotein diacylglyceryl transferase [uncultured Desulfobacteraceae bacterium]